MNLTATNRWALAAFTIIALAVVVGAVILVYSGKMMEGSFETLVILILSVFGVNAAVHTTGQVIQQTNGYKETTTTVVPSNPGNPTSVTTVKEPPTQ